MPHEYLILFHLNCFEFTLIIKLRTFNFKIDWNTFINLVKKDMVSDLNMSYGKKSHLVSFPFFGFTLVILLRNFNFVIH